MKQLANVTLALALLLTLGVCQPAASASAEGLLAAHKEEIAETIVQARSGLRSEAELIRADAQEFRADVAAIRRERRRERLELAETLVEAVEEHRAENGETLLETVEKQAADSVKGLVDVAVSDVQAELKDNPIHHDVIVTVDNSRFNRTVSPTPTPAPTPIPTVQPAPAVVRSASMSPKTADESDLSLWASLLGLSLLALGGASMLLKKLH